MALFKNFGNSGGLNRLSLPGDIPVVNLDLASLANTLDTTSSVEIPVATFCSGYVAFGGGGGTEVTVPSAFDIYNYFAGINGEVELAAKDGFIVNLLNYAASAVQFAPSSVDKSFIISDISFSENTGLELFVQFHSVQKPVSVVVDLVENSDIATLKFTSSLVTAAPTGNSPFSVNISTGAFVLPVEDYLADGTTVAELLYGQGGIAAFRLASNSAATGTVGLTIGPNIEGWFLKQYTII